MFFHSTGYMGLLESFLNSKPHYLVAVDDGQYVGALPLFLKENSEYGNIINSLPFVGSHGGFVVRRGADKQKVMGTLYSSFLEFAESKGCALSTIITPLFGESRLLCGGVVKNDFTEDRLSQVTELRPSTDLMYDVFEKRVRAAIRRPQKSGIKVEKSDDFGPLYKMHEEGVSAKGGPVKPIEFFKKIPKYFSPTEYSLNYAMKGDEIVAGLLLFYFKDTVEYFTPAIYEKYRQEQGNSLLIYEGMKDAVARGFRYWNFGGTRRALEGVYKFKQSWGAKEYPYAYYTLRHGDITGFQSAKPEELLEAYPWFYTLPFSALKSG